MPTRHHLYQLSDQFSEITVSCVIYYIRVEITGDDAFHLIGSQMDAARLKNTRRAPVVSSEEGR